MEPTTAFVVAGLIVVQSISMIDNAFTVKTQCTKPLSAAVVAGELPESEFEAAHARCKIDAKAATWLNKKREPNMEHANRAKELAAKQ